jgi:hypothetical protein
MPETTAKPFRYELIVGSPSGGVITSSSGMQIAGTRALGDLDEPLATVMIAGGRRRPCATSRRTRGCSNGSRAAHRT